MGPRVGGQWWAPMSCQIILQLQEKQGRRLGIKLLMGPHSAGLALEHSEWWHQEWQWARAVKNIRQQSRDIGGKWDKGSTGGWAERHLLSGNEFTSETKGESLVAVTHISPDGGPSSPEAQRKWKLDKHVTFSCLWDYLAWLLVGK